MVFPEAFGIRFHQLFEKLEESGEFFFALFVVFEGEMDFRQVKYQSHEQSAEFHIVIVGEFFHFAEGLDSALKGVEIALFVYEFR